LSLLLSYGLFYTNVVKCEEISISPSRSFPVVLLTPKLNEHIFKGPVTFRWYYRGTVEDSDFKTQRYEIVFWSKRRGFRKTFTVDPNSFSGIISIEFEESRKIFRRHGKYFWQIRAYDKDEKEIVSNKRSFIIDLPEIKEKYASWIYPYAIQFQYTQRIQTAEYKKFLQNIYPSTHLRSFFDLSLEFVQRDFGIPNLEIQERLYFLSQIGLGADISLRTLLFNTHYFTLNPRVSTQVYWFSTGLQNYSSMQYGANVGFDFIVMPKGHLTFRVCWIPSYRIHYSKKSEGIRIFKGEGWEWGFQIIIPQSILPVFKLFGINIDFQRIPIQFYFSRNRDKYSGTIMKQRRFGIGYHFR
jgi:hypothetical protein